MCPGWRLFSRSVPISHKIKATFENGNIEKANFLQYEAIEVINLLPNYHPLAAQKAIMKFIGLDCGTTKQPVEALSQEEEAQLFKDLEKTKFLVGRKI